MTDPTTRLLRRLIHDAGQVAVVRTLDGHRFSALVQAVGLEDSGELLAMATTDQMLATLDDVLWRSTDRRTDEHLDPERFAVWLEVLLEGGDAVAAQRLAEIPEELLRAGLCSQLFVFPIDALGLGMAGVSWDEAALAERVLDESLHLEFDHYTLVARHGLGWDPTIAGLLALDARDHDRVVRVLDACCRATTESLDRDEGWHTVLSAQETIDADAAADREDRRSRGGYVTPSTAAAFLAVAGQTPLDDESALAEDPVTRAYLRELSLHTIGPAGSAAPPSAADPRTARLGELIAAIDVFEGPRSLPSSSETSETSEIADLLDELREALTLLESRDPLQYERQMARLTYLANVLMAAGRADGSSYRPIDAGREALEYCARGLHDVQARSPGRHPWQILQQVGADGLFRRGWRLSASSPSSRP